MDTTQVVQQTIDWFAVIAICVSILSLTISGCSFYVAWKRYTLTPKCELLKTLMGTRYVLTEIMESKRKEALGNSFFTALNQASVVFGDDKDVIDALRVFQRNSANTANITDVLREMAKSAKVRDNKLFNDDTLMKPLTPALVDKLS